MASTILHTVASYVNIHVEDRRHEEELRRGASVWALQKVKNGGWDWFGGKVTRDPEGPTSQVMVLIDGDDDDLEVPRNKLCLQLQEGSTVEALRSSTDPVLNGFHTATIVSVDARACRYSVKFSDRPQDIRHDVARHEIRRSLASASPVQ